MTPANSTDAPVRDSKKAMISGAYLLQETISVTRRVAFEEQDAPVIVAQQNIIESAETEVERVILALDVGPVRYKQVLQKLIRAEQTA